MRAIVMSSLNNSSKSMTSCGRIGLSLTGHSCLAPYCDLVHVRPCRRQLGAATDQRCERQLESAISRTGAAIATPSAVVDVQVDFTGLAICVRIAHHKTGYAGLPHRSAEH